MAWLTMFTVFGALISLAYVQTTPQARLAWALGIELPADTTVARLREIDSFNDGATIWGACTADRELAGEIISRHSLSRGFTGGYISRYMPAADIPEEGIGYRNERLTCFHDADSGML